MGNIAHSAGTSHGSIAKVELSFALEAGFQPLLIYMKNSLFSLKLPHPLCGCRIIFFILNLIHKLDLEWKKDPLRNLAVLSELF